MRVEGNGIGVLVMLWGGGGGNGAVLVRDGWMVWLNANWRELVQGWGLV